MINNKVLKKYMSGPLESLKVIEMPAIGPAPFCGMLLADLGADVLRLDRREDAGLGAKMESEYDLLGRGKRSLTLDLKQPGACDFVLSMLQEADVLIEGFRPRTMERLGLGPEPALQRNPRLIYGRMTGWGQDGPLAASAGHDINYVALSGALHAIGRTGETPVPPLNLVGDFGGGGMYLTVGVLAALVERQRSGRGQVIDAAMVDGASSLMTAIYAMFAQGIWKDEPGQNMVDGGAPWYDTYRCADGHHVAIGPIERKFFNEMLRRMDVDPERFPDHTDPATWPEIRTALTRGFLSRTRAEWCSLLEGSDSCFAPVLSLTDAPNHPHNAARKTFVKHGGVVQPAPAPRFSRTPGAIRSGPPRYGAGGADALREWGVPVPTGFM